ncbi:Transcriptional regulator, GntR family [Lachnospiraceae bacterium TWA4]|nr:Transcriptional regulator, GntR family [Lachnospiraceae bacterium TWA4]
MQLCNQIIMGIALDQFTDGESLPSVRQLADTIGINMHTVNKAYSILRREGYIKLDRRKGAFISVEANKTQTLIEIKEQLHEIIMRAICKDISRKDVHQLVDEIFNHYGIATEED